MPSEMSKSIARRLRDPLFTTRVCRGAMLDVGGGYDGFEMWAGLFPLVTSVKNWDLPDGDAQYLKSLPDESFDAVISSHCLEHMRDPFEALTNWWRVVKPGGHLAVIVPDEDLYEQGVFPSTFNGDHKATFTLDKRASWSPVSVNVTDLLRTLPDAKWLRLELLDSTYRYGIGRTDQTGTIVTESAIEFVVQKRGQAG